MKFLKSLICLLLVLSMIFCLAACGDDDKSDKDDKDEKIENVDKDDEDEKIENVDKDDEDEKDTKDSEETTEKEPAAPKAEVPSGTYVLYKAEYEGEVVMAEDVGIQMALTFNDDGTGVATDGEESEEFEWEGNEMTSSGDTVTFEFVDGEVIVEEAGTVLYFAPGELTFGSSSNSGSNSMEVPSGTYELYTMEYLGEVITAADMGLEMSFTFNDDGTGEVFDGQTSEEFEWEGNVMTDNTGDTLEFDFVDGELIVDMDGVVMYFH